jgi:hypothetical protein
MNNAEFVSKFVYASENEFRYVAEKNDPLVDAIIKYISDSSIPIQWTYSYNLNDINCDIKYRFPNNVSLTFEYSKFMSAYSFTIYINEKIKFVIVSKVFGLFTTNNFHGLDKILSILKKRRRGERIILEVSGIDYLKKFIDKMAD